MFLKKKRKDEHPLAHALKRFFGLSEMEIRWELWRLGHNVYPGRILSMLRGHEPMPSEIEAALRRIAAEHIEERPLTQEQADLLIDWWLRGDQDEPSPLF
jgi:hypothetical protein